VSIAGWILPGIVDRPLSIVRCPDGVGHPCFFQRHIAASLPDDLHVVHPEGKGAESYFSIGDIRGLISLVQVGALEIHPWGAPGSHVEYADRVIFDLDPDPAVGWEEVVRAAHLCRDRLAKLDLKAFVRTTGGKGLHVVAPLDGTRDWDVVKTFAHRFADAMVDAEPDRFIAVMSKAGRKGKIFVDYLRNDRTATAIASYSTRARTGAPVATPLTWDELSAKTDPRSFDIHTVAARLKALKADPWRGFAKSAGTCPETP
jgi:bifunctional non-homologous end joining protein LigD